MKRRVLCLLICIFLIITAFVLRFSRYYTEACNVYANNGIKSDISNKLNRYIIEEIALKNVSYSELAKIQYLENSKASIITVDSVEIVNIAAEISINLTNEIKAMQGNFGVPLGNALGFAYLSAKGPKIAVNIIPVGYVSYEINSQLISGGVNQAVHRIGIDFKAEIECLTPFNKEVIYVNSSVILAETLIIGEVPQILVPSA